MAEEAGTTRRAEEVAETTPRPPRAAFLLGTLTRRKRMKKDERAEKNATGAVPETEAGAGAGGHEEGDFGVGKERRFENFGQEETAFSRDRRRPENRPRAKHHCAY